MTNRNVIARLVRAIHLLQRCGMDHPDKPGDDDGEVARLFLTRVPS